MKSVAAVLAICLGLGSGSAEALSCLRVDPKQAFSAAQAASRSYSVVVGRFSFNASQLPKGGKPVSIRATLSGRGLSKTGFNAQFSKTVRLDIDCEASWCASVTPGDPYLVFVEHGPQGLAVDIGLCPGWVFADPTKADERAITECFKAGTCR